MRALTVAVLIFLGSALVIMAAVTIVYYMREQHRQKPAGPEVWPPSKIEPGPLYTAHLLLLEGLRCRRPVPHVVEAREVLGLDIFEEGVEVQPPVTVLWSCAAAGYCNQQHHTSSCVVFKTNLTRRAFRVTSHGGSTMTCVTRFESAVECTCGPPGGGMVPEGGPSSVAKDTKCYDMQGLLITNLYNDADHTEMSIENTTNKL